MKYLVNTKSFKTEPEALDYAKELAVQKGTEVVVYVNFPYLRSMRGEESVNFSIFLEKVACDQLTDTQVVAQLKEFLSNPLIWSIHEHFEVHPDGTITQENPFDDPYYIDNTLYYPDH